MFSELLTSSGAPVHSIGLCCVLRGRLPPSASMSTIKFGSTHITMSAFRLEHRVVHRESLPLGSERTWELEFYMAVAASVCYCPGVFSHAVDTRFWREAPDLKAGADSGMTALGLDGLRR